MKVTDHLDIEKVSQRGLSEWLTIARLQGQWTAASSLLHQAESLGTEGPIMRQFKVNIERVESRLAQLGADKSSAIDATTDDSTNDEPVEN
jgi:hypothetical protein